MWCIRSPACKSLGTCASFGCDYVGHARLDCGPPCARNSVVAILLSLEFIKGLVPNSGDEDSGKLMSAATRTQ